MGKYRELAAAIRKGAKMRPQSFGSSYDGTGSCVMGAIYEALTGKTSNTYFDGYDAACAAGIWPTPLVPAHLWIKNDRGQTREQIADWLESLEPRISDEQYTADFIKKMENAPQLETQHG